ncbi:MAG: YqaJ viral recombinase family protein [Acutalibacteraceae bacterium]
MNKTDYKPGVLTETSKLSREEWLKWRRKGIGGSDAAAVLGVSPYATARDLYYDKVNIVSSSDEDSGWVQKEIGHLLEDLVAQIFSRKTGYEVFKEKKMFFHPIYPYMLADLDYLIKLPGDKTAILEIKTTNYNAKDNWWLDGKETVPVNYEIQGRHYMAVTNIDCVYYCCLYGNSEDEVIIRHIDRDFIYEEELIALEGEFWNSNVTARVPPPYLEDGDLVLESVNRHIGAPNSDAPKVKLNAKTESQVIRFLELQAEKRKLESEKKKIESEMKRLQGCILTEMGKSRNALCTLNGEPYRIEYNSVYKPTVGKDSLFRLKEQYPEVYESFVTVAESRRFYVKKSQNSAA